MRRFGVLVLMWVCFRLFGAPAVLAATQPHDNFSHNQEACSTCHGKDPAVKTCYACHDGTMSTYNVLDGLIGATGTRTAGGLFGRGNESGLSHHDIDTGITVAAAPGGPEREQADQNGEWTETFTCASCHTIHKGTNSRLLNPNPNGVAMLRQVTGEVLRAVSPGMIYAGSKPGWIDGYPYSQYTKIYVNGAIQSTGFAINYWEGTVAFNPAISPAAQVKADYVPGIQVAFVVTGKYTVDEKVTYLEGINEFCGACHTDYNTATTGINAGHTAGGSYRTAFRHGVGMVWDDLQHNTNIIQGSQLHFENVHGQSGTVTCLTCHYAHGTDDELMGVNNPDGRSSALKRLGNSTLCEMCHQK